MTPPAQDSITPLNGNPTTKFGGHPVVGLIIAFAICFGAAALGSLATAPEIGGWYQTLKKPSWQPPNWLFGPVWSLLFAMMAISAWLVWRHSGFSGARTPLLLFSIQLILNCCLVVALLPAPSTRLGVLRNHDPVGRDPNDHALLLRPFDNSRLVACPLPRLGQLRGDAEFDDLEVEPDLTRTRSPATINRIPEALTP